MTTIEQRLHDGAQAREVLENEQFNASFDAIEKELIDAWKASPARDADGRERIWAYLHLMQKFKAHLTTTMETGKLAQLDLEHKRKQDSWMTRMKNGLTSFAE